MKELISYYYNFDILEIKENKYYYKFNYLNDTYYFVFFNRLESELKDIINLSQELKYKGIMVHDIIINRFNSYLTKVGDLNYLLLKINSLESTSVNFMDLVNSLDKLRLNQKTSNLYRNNWGELWSNKIDYFEYQIKEIGKDKKIIVDSFSYYVGLTENAISYVNKINKVIGKSEQDYITLSHRRLFFPNTNLNYLNPLSFIFDLEVRDIAEYLKSEFFQSKEDAYLDLKMFLQVKKLTPYSYHLLYARLLYPSYYFDLYDEVMNNNLEEEVMLKVIKEVDNYEKFLEFAYLEISKYTNLERIDWLIKKEL